jgi:hypothetical protein
MRRWCPAAQSAYQGGTYANEEHGNVDQYLREATEMTN